MAQPVAHSAGGLVLTVFCNRSSQNSRVLQSQALLPQLEIPIEEELLAACEYALEWFEDWSRHVPDECVFGGEAAVMKRLRRAIGEVWIREELL